MSSGKLTGPARIPVSSAALLSPTMSFSNGTGVDGHWMISGRIRVTCIHYCLQDHPQSLPYLPASPLTFYEEVLRETQKQLAKPSSVELKEHPDSEQGSSQEAYPSLTEIVPRYVCLVRTRGAALRSHLLSVVKMKPKADDHHPPSHTPYNITTSLIRAASCGDALSVSMFNTPRFGWVWPTPL